jgi:microcystin-dependent protein
VGALAYFFEAGTSTPMPVYSSADLGTANVHPHPVVADGNARWPQVFFDDTDYAPDDPLVSGRRFYDVKVTDAAGVLIYYDKSVPIIGTVTGEGGGGGGVPVDQNALAQTGDMKMKFCAANDPADAGWVRCNGGTISKDGGGGSELASAATQGLFEYLWNKHGDIICPVVGGRGGTAITDFNAGRKLTLPDMRGRAPFGIDVMGNASANRIAATYIDTASPATRDTVGAIGGDDDIALTTAQMPAHSHDATGVPAWAGPTPPATAAKLKLQAPAHTHLLVADVASLGAGLTNTNHISVDRHGEGEESYVLRGESPPLVIPTLGLSAPTGPLDITGNTGLTGGPTPPLYAGNASAHENMPPFLLITFQIKL